MLLDTAWTWHFEYRKAVYNAPVYVLFYRQLSPHMLALAIPVLLHSYGILPAVKGVAAIVLQQLVVSSHDCQELA